MKAKSINKASYNELDEILSMCATLENTIHEYLHVEEYLPENIKTGIRSFREKVTNILEKIDNGE